MLRHTVSLSLSQMDPCLVRMFAVPSITVCSFETLYAFSTVLFVYHCCVHVETFIRLHLK